MLDGVRTLLTAPRPHWRRTCVVLGLQVQVVQLVDVTDVHLLLVELRLVEVLKRQKKVVGRFYERLG